MNQTQANRFAKLIGGLEEGLHRENFDMTRYTRGMKGSYKSQVKRLHESNCGTTCCVMGFTPAIFPDRFVWSGNGVLHGVDDKGYRLALIISSAKGFFGITSDEYDDLFTGCKACGRGYDSQIKYMQNFLDSKGYTDVWVNA